MLVSVLMPARNAAATIGEAITSVIRQTHTDLELLVADDASDDATASIVEGYGDPRITLIRNSCRLGPGRSRDLLIDVARGDHVAVLDADDVYAPGRLQRLLDVAPPGEGLVFDDIMECHQVRGGLHPWRRIHGSGFGPPAANQALVPCTLTDLISARRFLIKPIISRAALDRLGVRHPDVTYAEDGGFFWTLLARGMPAYYLPEAHYFYRITPGSASSFAGRSGVLADVIERLLEEDIDPPTRDAINRRIRYLRHLATFTSYSSLPPIRRVLASTSCLIQNPALLQGFVAGLPARVDYQLSRLIHGGAIR